MLLYFAGPLFNDGELAFNESLTNQIEELDYQVFLPQRNGFNFDEEPYISMKPEIRAKAIFDLDWENLLEADVFLYVLDGRIPDEGAAVALGIVHTHKKLSDRKQLIIGLHTDTRAAFINQKLNPMIFAPMDFIAKSVKELLDYLKNYNC